MKDSTPRGRSRSPLERRATVSTTHPRGRAGAGRASEPVRGTPPCTGRDRVRRRQHHRSRDLAEWFPDVQVLNRGIGGDTTSQILRRIGTAIHAPKAVFLLAGTNDLHSGSRPAEVAQRIGAIADAILATAPGVQIHLQSIMPRGANFAREIAETNELTRALVASRHTVQYLDLWPALADSKQALRDEYTFDGLHLTGRGYAAWVDVLRPIVARYGETTTPHPPRNEQETRIGQNRDRESTRGSLQPTGRGLPLPGDPDAGLTALGAPGRCGPLDRVSSKIGTSCSRR